MIPLQFPDNEGERLAALVRQEILDTPEEIPFNEIVHLASRLCESQIVLISLVDENRQWFKAKHGISATETRRSISFCSYAIQEDDVFEVPDALADERFKDNPLVLGEPNIRFYAGYPLRSNDGYKLGTLCLIDNYPRQLSEQQRHYLAMLGQQVEQILSLRLELLHDLRALLKVLFLELDNSGYTSLLGSVNQIASCN